MGKVCAEYNFLYIIFAADIVIQPPSLYPGMGILIVSRYSELRIPIAHMAAMSICNHEPWHVIIGRLSFSFSPGRWVGFGPCGVCRFVVVFSFLLYLHGGHEISN